MASIPAGGAAAAAGGGGGEGGRGEARAAAGGRAGSGPGADGCGLCPQREPDRGMLRFTPETGTQEPRRLYSQNHHGWKRPLR